MAGWEMSGKQAQITRGSSNTRYVYQWKGLALPDIHSTAPNFVQLSQKLFGYEALALEHYRRDQINILYSVTRANSLLVADAKEWLVVTIGVRS